MSFEKNFSTSISLAGSDLDSDSFGKDVDSDGDGFGISDIWEFANGFNPHDKADAASDPGVDGVSNLAEFNANSNPHLDVCPPIFEAPQRVVLNSAGLLMPVPAGIAPRATDAKDGSVSVVALNAEATNVLRSGQHVIDYEAKDRAGNLARLQQVIDIWPRVSFRQDLTVGEGTQAEFMVILNGQAPKYPFTMYYHVSGSAFTEDPGNSIVSAVGMQRSGPAPGRSDYLPDLIAGSCGVQLLIQDGGSNDADRMANRAVYDPSGIGTIEVGLTPSESTIAVTGAVLTTFTTILVLTAAALGRVLNRFGYITAIILLTVCSAVNAQPPGKKPGTRFPGKTLEFQSFTPAASESNTANVSAVNSPERSGAFYALNRDAPWYLAGSAVALNSHAPVQKWDVTIRASASPWYLGGGAARVGPTNILVKARAAEDHARLPIHESRSYITQSARNVSDLTTRARHEWYLAGSISLVSREFDRASVDALNAQHQDQIEVNVKNERFGYQLAWGYLFNPRWGVEVGYANLGEVTVAAKGQSSDPLALATILKENAPSTGVAYSLGATFNYSIGWPWFLLVDGGALEIRSKRQVTISGTPAEARSVEYGMYAGGGVRRIIYDSLSVGVHYQHLFEDRGGVDVINAFIVWYPQR